MWTEEFVLKIVSSSINEELSHRIVALDLETRIEDKSDFLTNEIILGVSIARRNPFSKIEKKIIILNEETEESEYILLEELSQILLDWKPLVIVGYGCRDYDLPLLAMKKQKLKLEKRSIWGISNILNGSIHIELSDLSRYLFTKKFGEPRKYRSMAYVMKHKHFQDIPFIDTKSEFELSFEEKGKQIYESWKMKDSKFKNYLEAEAHDQLLIAEKIFSTKFDEV